MCICVCARVCQPGSLAQACCVPVPRVDAVCVRPHGRHSRVPHTAGSATETALPVPVRRLQSKPEVPAGPLLVNTLFLGHRWPTSWHVLTWPVCGAGAPEDTDGRGSSQTQIPAFLTYSPYWSTVNGSILHLPERVARSCSCSDGARRRAPPIVSILLQRHLSPPLHRAVDSSCCCAAKWAHWSLISIFLLNLLWRC